MITDTIVGLVLIAVMFASAFLATVALVITLVFVALHAPTSLLWVLGLVEVLAP